jgi:hypothetical protein
MTEAEKFASMTETIKFLDGGPTGALAVTTPDGLAALRRGEKAEICITDSWMGELEGFHVADPRDVVLPCLACRGEGKLEQWDCPETGRRIYDTCFECKGAGKVKPLATTRPCNCGSGNPSPGVANGCIEGSSFCG